MNLGIEVEAFRIWVVGFWARGLDPGLRVKGLRVKGQGLGVEGSRV